MDHSCISFWWEFNQQKQAVKSQKRNLSSAFGNYRNINELEFIKFAYKKQIVKRSREDSILMCTDNHASKRKKNQKYVIWLKNNLNDRKHAPV